ncbi:MAG: hypothetical protein NT062_12425 [Proteobacteria bacterium]|nr:hypothetical protein [Pseudomonadota bacterium]
MVASLASAACDECTVRPVVRCGRCSTTRCAAHAFAPGARCDRCEHDYADEAPTRRSAKILVAPPIAILSGGLLFGIAADGSIAEFR